MTENLGNEDDSLESAIDKVADAVFVVLSLLMHR